MGGKLVLNKRRTVMKKENIFIREAVRSDFEWVASLMHDYLEPYYGGDHHAHAKRIFNAHIAGGYDSVGFFSFEQKMFIIEVDGMRAGMLHLVGKRQSTYKISPLIILSGFQNKLGLGSRLLGYAKNYARNSNARQLYCTVAEKNISAMQFFLRKGFIQAGSSDSHYKNGITETMLYKPLYEISKVESLEKVHVSVLPLNEVKDELKKEVAQLLLEKLPKSFEGITNEWVKALFSGHERRNMVDINVKYKLIFIALDSIGHVIGVAGATPKKGNPIKIMPFIAANGVAFEALLIDISYQLVPYGHKMYVHINPSVDEVISLQRLGWKIDAVMPNAYYPGITTQQWSLNIGENIMRSIRIKQRFFDLIKLGKKTLEVRVGYDSINRIKNGEIINLMTHASSLNVKVGAIRRYNSFSEMLTKEAFNKIAPDISSQKELLNLLKKIYPPNKEKLGVVVLEFVK